MQISNIDASLSHGNFLGKKQFFVLYTAMITSLLLPLITIVMIAVQVKWDNQKIFALTVGNMIFLSFFAVLNFIMIKNNKLRKKIIIWLEDAIETTAYSKQMGENRLGAQPKAVKIQLKFKIDDITYRRDSTAKVFGGQKGYLGTYKKYADREISILYSKKYDEVLILKDKQETTKH